MSFLQTRLETAVISLSGKLTYPYKLSKNFKLAFFPPELFKLVEHLSVFHYFKCIIKLFFIIYFYYFSHLICVPRIKLKGVFAFSRYFSYFCVYINQIYNYKYLYFSYYYFILII